MRYLFFDTETSGLPKDKSVDPHRDLDNWPRVIQLAYVLADDQGHPLEQASFIINPKGEWEAAEQAIAVHGITNELANEVGVELKRPLLLFNEALKKADILVAHNMNFDFNVIYSEYLRTKIDVSSITNISQFCTMLSTIEYCGIPFNKNRSGKYKWPKLSELHERVFGESFVGAHDALVDVNACIKCFFKLRVEKVIDCPG